MGTPTLKVVFDRNHRASAKKEGAIEIRITYGRIQRHVTTGVRCLPKHFKNGFIVNRTDAFELQTTLDMFITHTRKVLNSLWEKGELDMNTVVSIINGKQKDDAKANTSQGDVLVAAYIEERMEIRKFGKAKDTQERYDRFFEFFEKWGGIVTWDDVTPQNVIKMDAAIDELCKVKHMKEASKWHNYHRFLNSFIIDAIDDGMIKKNPYKSGINIKKVESTGGLEKYLTKDEFNKIAKVKLNSDFLIHARDLFLFQTYTCMAYTDMVQFDVDKIKIVGGKPMYCGYREKTDKPYNFLLMKPAMEILKKYDNILPIMCNQDYNKALKIVALSAGIKKTITTHWARHTGATLLLNAGVDMEIVSRVLGHSSTKMTREVYAKMLDTTIVDAMSKVTF